MPEEVKHDTEKNNKDKKKPTKLEKWFKFMHRVQRFLSLGAVPIIKYGHTEPYNDRSYIIVGNHKSNLDVLPTAIATDNPVHFMAKKELFEKGICKWFTKKCECIPVSRDGADIKAVMQAMRYLKEGSTICIFPEGTRNRTDEPFLPFKSGAATLAIKTKTPIIPVIILDKMKLFRKTQVYYGEPFCLTEFYDKKLTQEDIEKADAVLYEKFVTLYNDLKLRREKKK